jgi:hypothetical protein
MADTKITGLTELAEQPASTDMIPLVDTSDTTQATSGTTKKITRANLIGTVTEGEGGTGETTYTDGQLLVGNTAGGLTKATITGGANVSVTNGDGSISIAATDTTGISDVVEDTTPQLGGSLDVNSQSIVSASNGNIPITPDGSGKVVLDGLSWPTADGTNGQVIQSDGAGNLSFTDNDGGGGGGSTNSFATIALSADGGSASGDSSVAADSATDTLNLKAGSGVTITGASSTDSVTIAASAGNSFGTVAVSGQSDVVADAANDTLTLAAGSNVTLTTAAGTDTVTVAATDTNTTYTATGAVTLTGTEFSHTDTSSASDVDNADGNVLQDITFDTYGHVASVGSTDLDTRYSQTSHNHSSTYQPLDSDLTDLAALAKTDGNVIVGNGSAWVAESGATARTSLGLTIGTDVAAETGTAKLAATQTWTKAQIPSTRTAAFEQPDFDTYQNFVFTLTSATTHTLTNPTTDSSNAGQTGVIVLIQPSSGTAASLAITASGDYKPVGGVAPTLSTALSSVDILPYMIQADNTILLGAPQLDFKATS